MGQKGGCATVVHPPSSTKEWERECLGRLESILGHSVVFRSSARAGFWAGTEGANEIRKWTIVLDPSESALFLQASNF